MTTSTERLRIVLDLDAETDALEGTLEVREEQPVAFRGWMEFVAALERVRSAARDRARSACDDRSTPAQ